MTSQPLRYDQPAWNLDARIYVVPGVVVDPATGWRVAFRARQARMMRHAQNSIFSSLLVVAWNSNVLLRVVLGVRLPAAGSRVAFRARPVRMNLHA